jgi:hypothetical protein
MASFVRALTVQGLESSMFEIPLVTILQASNLIGCVTRDNAENMGRYSTLVIGGQRRHLAKKARGFVSAVE